MEEERIELDESVFLQITDQIGVMIDDYKAELQKGFASAEKYFPIGFKVKIAPSREAGKIKVSTTIRFDTEPKPKHDGKVKDSMEVVVDTKQQPLPGID